MRATASAGALILIVPNGSPFELGKVGQRLELAHANAPRETRLPLPVYYLNQIGGQDELVFDEPERSSSTPAGAPGRRPACLAGGGR